MYRKTKKEKDFSLETEKKLYLRLRHPNMEPPSGFVYRDLETNVWISSHANLQDLIQKCINHRHANKLPIPDDFAKFIESSICWSIDPSLVIGFPEDYKPTKYVLARFTVNNFTTIFLQKWKNAGQKLVSIEEAANRTSLCLNCEFNSKHLCLTCSGSDEWIGGWNGRKKQFDSRTGVCQCDAVILFASVHAENPGVDVDSVSVIYPEYCWKNKKE